MPKQAQPIPLKEFNDIFSKVPRLTVEVVVRTAQGIALTKLPSKYSKDEQWYLPGGTVRFNEPLTVAVRRVAEEELGVEVEVGRLLGYIEYPSLLAAGYKGWPVGIAFEVSIVKGKLTVNDEGEPVECFKNIPENTLQEQHAFLTKYLQEYPF